MDYDWRTWASSSENIHMAAYTGGGEKHPKMIIFQILDAFVPSSQQLGLDQTRNWRGMWRQSRLYWLRTSWVTLNISRWFYLLRSFPDDFIYFEVFQKILFIWTLSDDFIYFEPFQMILYLLWTLPDGFIYFEPLQMMAQLPEEWKSKRSKSKKSGAGNKRPGFGSRCCLHSINLFAHLGFLNRDGF